MRNVSQKMLKRARTAKTNLKQILKHHPDVMGMGIGYRERNGKLNNRCCIRVHVRKKFLAHLMPPQRRLPEEIDGIPIDVIEGEYYIHDSSSPSDYHRSLKAGIQVANKNNYPKIGTLGCIVRDEITGDPLLLSNWHVLYGQPGAGHQQPVVQPRAYGNMNIIGTTRMGIINEAVDCAVAQLNTNRSLSDGILNFSGTISGYKSVTLGMPVAKSGVNGIAFGTVDEVDFDISIDTPIGTVKFEDQVHIAPRQSGNSPFDVDDGDSGSVWFCEADYKAVALHMAGESNTRAVANHFSTVITAMADRGVYLSV